MIITMNANATREHIENVENIIESYGYTVHPIHGSNRTVLAQGDERVRKGFERLVSQPLRIRLSNPPSLQISMSRGSQRHHSSGYKNRN